MGDFWPSLQGPSCPKLGLRGGVGINHPPFSNIVYFVIFPSLGGHLSPYWSFGATMNIGAIGVIGSIGSTSAIGATGVSTGSIGVTGANPYIIGSHSECHQQPPLVVVVGKQLC